jgi:hypothetical protein
MKGPARKNPAGEEHIRRVRRLCSALPEATEKLSHGEPTFFVKKKVYAMFANNHHDDGHIAVWIPVPPGAQASSIRTEPNSSSCRHTWASAAGSALNFRKSTTRNSQRSCSTPGA